MKRLHAIQQQIQPTGRCCSVRTVSSEHVAKSWKGQLLATETETDHGSHRGMGDESGHRPAQGAHLLARDMVAVATPVAAAAPLLDGGALRLRQAPPRNKCLCAIILIG